jgi:arsenical pump membrane protein
VPIVAFVLAGFTVGSTLGVPAWTVAAVAVAWAAAATGALPWRTVPYEAMLVAAALAVLVAGAVADLRIHGLLDAGGVAGRLRALGFATVASNATNNLPAVLAGAASLHDRSQAWPLLVGANIGPVLVITGTLSGLLWRDTARRLGVAVSARRYTAVGLRVGLPALLVAGAAVVVLS